MELYEGQALADEIIDWICASVVSHWQVYITSLIVLAHRCRAIFLFARNNRNPPH